MFEIAIMNIEVDFLRWLRFENALRNVLGSKSNITGLASLYEQNKSERKTVFKKAPIGAN